MRALRHASTVMLRQRWVLVGLTLSLVLALGGSLALVLPGRAHAATIPVSSCTERALKAAVAAASPGDTIQFGCSGTITLTSDLVIYNDLTLDGTGHNVTLSGGHAVKVLDVIDVNFTLNHLTIADGLAAGNIGINDGQALGGGLYTAGSTVTLSNCAFVDNTARAADGNNGTSGFGGSGGTAFGGGLFAVNSTLSLTNCRFTGNTTRGGDGGNGSGDSTTGAFGGSGGSAVGGGIYVWGTVTTLANCAFTGSTAQGGLGGEGGNSAGSGGGGGAGGEAAAGAVFVAAGIALTVSGSTFTGNIAKGGAGGAGGSGGSGEGGSGGDGGSVSAGGLLSSLNDLVTGTSSTFASNTAQGGSGGAGGNSNSGTGGSGGTGGQAWGGSLITNNGSSASTILTNITIANNTAQGGPGSAGGSSNAGAGGSGGSGGDSLGGGLYTSNGDLATVDKLINSTLANNTAQGGSAAPGGTGSSSNGASGAVGSGEGNSVEVTTDGLHIANSILSSGPGTNCAGAFFSIHDDGYNLDSGTSCGFSSANHSLSNTDPKLGPLAHNGRPTQTMALLPGSPAIDAGGTSANGCPATDQRGVSRPQGAACDIGAYEFVPTTKTTLTANPNPGLLDQPVQLCATVQPTNNTAAPTGGVTFQEGATTLGTATLSGGKGCFTTSSLSLGDHHISARYGGDGSFSASASAPLVVSIQVQGQDVAGGGSGGGSPPSNPPSQGQATGGQSASGSGAGQTQQPVARHPGAGGLASWLGTGLGLLLLLLGLGGLGGVFYRASRRRSAVGTEPKAG